MIKEALSEVLSSMQCVPHYQDSGMDSIADFAYRAYKVISKDLCKTLLERGRTCVIFAGYCITRSRLRALKIETDHHNVCSKKEVLTVEGQQLEAFGSGATPQFIASITGGGEVHVIRALQSVIDDHTVSDVGGNVQYGYFVGSSFQTSGVVKRSDDGVHCWRGPLDLNGPDFDQSEGLVPNFPMLDLIDGKKGS